MVTSGASAAWDWGRSPDDDPASSKHRYTGKFLVHMMGCPFRSGLERGYYTRAIADNRASLRLGQEGRAPEKILLEFSDRNRGRYPYCCIDAIVIRFLILKYSFPEANRVP